MQADAVQKPLLPATPYSILSDNFVRDPREVRSISASEARVAVCQRKMINENECVKAWRASRVRPEVSRLEHKTMVDNRVISRTWV